MILKMFLEVTVFYLITENKIVCIRVHVFSVGQELIFRQAHSNLHPVVPKKYRLNCTFTFLAVLAIFPDPVIQWIFSDTIASPVECSHLLRINLE